MDTRIPSAIGNAGRAAERVPGAGAALAYAALRNAVAVVDRTGRARTIFTGPSAATVLTGLVTSDVPALTPGQGQYAAVLTPKGKIIADVRIFALTDHLLVDAAPRAAAGWWATVRKFVNPRLAKYTDAGATLGDVGVFGALARRSVAGIMGVSEAELAALAFFGHLPADFEGVPVTIARVPDLGVEGYEVFGPPSVTLAVRERAIGAGATPAGDDVVAIARIEAGRPEWGLDMDDSTLPQEVNLDSLHAISFTKGCYTGQETVARIHFRGHVNRNLRGLRFDASVPPPTGAELMDDGAERAVGDVRSVAISPRLGGIALAMIRREIADGAWLTARWEAGTARVHVDSLPFPP